MFDGVRRGGVAFFGRVAGLPFSLEGGGVSGRSSASNVSAYTGVEAAALRCRVACGGVGGADDSSDPES